MAYSVYLGYRGDVVEYVGMTSQKPERRFSWHRSNGKRLRFEVVFSSDCEVAAKEEEDRLILLHLPTLNKRGINLPKSHLTKQEIADRLESGRWCQKCLRRRVNHGYKICLWCERASKSAAPKSTRVGGREMQYTGKLYGEGGIPLMLTASDVDALESMHSRLCAALGLPADSTPETVAEEVEARRVVVPELTEEALVRAGRPYCINDREPFQRGARWAAAFIREHSRAIPADRVLGEGEIKGTPEELAKIAESAGWKWIRSPIESKETKTLVEWMTDALRANQGGAKHGNV